VSTRVRTIFEQPDAASVRARHAQVVAALEAKLPGAAAHLDQARDDILAFAAFPGRSGGRSGAITRRSG
jgi:putative transposase